MDNRFAYMRKHLGFSQKDASIIFSTRLDTIKKWDSGKLYVPGPVLEELYNHIHCTNDLIDEFCEEIEWEQEDDPSPEIFLQTFTRREELAERGLPPSLGWQDHVIGAIMGRIAMQNVYGANTLPPHYKPDTEWYEHWALRGNKKKTDYFVVKDEAMLSREIETAIQRNTWDVAFDPKGKYYHIGFRTKSVSNAAHTIWIMLVRAHNDETDKISENNPLKYYNAFGEDGPYIYRADRTKVPVGLPSGHEDDTVDPHTLAELIFAALSKSYPTEGEMRNACRNRYAKIVSADYAFPSDINWDVKDSRYVSHNFISALFFETQKQTGHTLHPEILVELCETVAQSEPAIHGIDHADLVIDMGEMVITITLDLRDVITQSSNGGDFHTEATKALEVIKASIENEGLTRIEPFSTIEIDIITNDDDGEGFQP